MVKKFIVELGVTAALTVALRLLGRLAAGLTSNAIMGWGDDQIAAWLGITAPSFIAAISFVTAWGPPLFLAVVTMWLYHRWHGRGVVAPYPQVKNETISLEERAEAAMRRISSLAGKHPRIMPDHPSHRGPLTNEAADALFMREYQEAIAADVRAILAEADRRDLLDHGDRIYISDNVIARRGVEAIGSTLARVIANVKVGSRRPLPPREFDEAPSGNQPFAVAHLLIDGKNTYTVLKKENIPSIAIQEDFSPELRSFTKPQTHHAYVVLDGHRKFTVEITPSLGITATISSQGDDFVRIKLVWWPFAASPMPTSGTVSFRFYR
jgi:hypothetical protein